MPTQENTGQQDKSPGQVPVRGLVRRWLITGAAPVRLGRELQLASRRVVALGPRRGAGLGFLATGLLVVVGLVLPMQRETARLRERFVALQAAPPVVVSRDPIADFTAQLPTLDQLPKVMATTLAQAKTAGVELERGSYRLVSPPNGFPHRYEVSLPVSGRYADIRSFIDGSLAAVPALALDGLSIERQDVASDELAVEIQFVVFVRSGQ